MSEYLLQKADELMEDFAREGCELTHEEAYDIVLEKLYEKYS